MFRQRKILIHTVLSLFLSQLVFWMVFLNYDRLPPEVPLWNLQPWGSHQLASVEYVWTLPGIAIGVLATHLLLTTFIHRKQPFLVGLVMGLTTVINLFIFLATVSLLSRMLGWG